MLYLDRSRVGNVTGDNKSEVLEGVDRASGDALGLVFSNKEDFTKVGGRSGVVGLRTLDDATYKADLRLCGRVGALYMYYVE